MTDDLDLVLSGSLAGQGLPGDLHDGVPISGATLVQSTGSVDWEVAVWTYTTLEERIVTLRFEGCDGSVPLGFYGVDIHAWKGECHGDRILFEVTYGDLYSVFTFWSSSIVILSCVEASAELLPWNLEGSYESAVGPER